MCADANTCASDLGRYRHYLHVVACAHLDARLRRTLDASDLVQETLLRAWKSWDQFNGAGDGQRVAWLRTTLLHVLIDKIRQRARTCRDGPEGLLQADLERSSLRLETSLAAEQSSPSQGALRHEMAVRLADALAELPEAQRTAIELQRFEGRTLSEIAQSMGRTPAAVGGLLKRGLERLRQLMQEQE